RRAGSSSTATGRCGEAARRAGAVPSRAGRRRRSGCRRRSGARGGTRGGGTRARPRGRRRRRRAGRWRAGGVSRRRGGGTPGRRARARRGALYPPTITFGDPGGRILPVGDGTGATQPLCITRSPTRATGLLHAITVAEPIITTPGPFGTQP